MKISGSDIRTRLFSVAWILFVVSQMASITAWYVLCDSPMKVYFYKGAAVVSCVVCVVVIVINVIRHAYGAKTFICYIAFGIVCALSWVFTKDFYLIWIFGLSMAAYEIDSRRIVKISALIMAAALVLVVICSQIGLAQDYIFMDEGRDRHSLGFVWTTVAPTLLFFVSLQYIFLRKSKMKFWEYLIIEAANVFLFIMTDTKMPLFALTAVFIFFAVEGLFKNHWKFWGKLNILYYILPVLICIFTMVVYYALDRNSEIFVKLNEILNSRLYFGVIGTDTFGIKPFGQPIVWSGGSIEMTSVANYFYVDSSYINVMLEAGVVFLAAAIAVYTRLMYRACKAKDYWLVILAAVVLVYCFSEPWLMDLSFNVFPILAFAGLREEIQNEG